MIFADQFQSALDLECLVPSAKEAWDIPTAEPYRPGMQFCGYYEFFAYERPQILGKVEMSYLETRTPEERRELLTRFFSYDIPCVTICRGDYPPPELVEIACSRGIPVYLSHEITTKFTTRIIRYLERCLAPQTSVHGVLLDIYGTGVLLMGKSGVGKSEAALELVRRGHQLVADDQVEIRRVTDTRLVGTCPENIRHLMEIHGLGLIDIRSMYGVSAVSMSKTIDLVIELSSWDSEATYDRIKLKEDYIEILDVPVVCQKMFVKPGRNLAVLIEVAARNHTLNLMGINPSLELQKRLIRQMEARNTNPEE